MITWLIIGGIAWIWLVGLTLDHMYEYKRRLELEQRVQALESTLRQLASEPVPPPSKVLHG